MIRHAMAYVQMSQRVREELGHHPQTAYWLEDVELGLTAAEGQLVRRYRDWRRAMKHAAELGSKRAAEYLERTTWDLT